MCSQFWRPEIQSKGVSRATLSGGSRRETVHCLFQLMMAVGIPGLVAASLQPTFVVTMPPPLSQISHFLSLNKRHLSLDLATHLPQIIQDDVISRSQLNYTCKIILPNEAQSQVPGITTNHLGNHHSTHYTTRF